MRNRLSFVWKCLGILAVALGLFLLYKGLRAGYAYYTAPPLSPVDLQKEISTTTLRTLDKYRFSVLRDTPFRSDSIKIEKELKRDPLFTAYVFSYTFQGKKITGRLNIPVLVRQSEISTPSAQYKAPVIVLLRGYVDKEIYYTGIGTERASEAYARAGFVTLAPDFLGFGGSDEESYDVFESRFAKPAQILKLLASVETLPFADSNKIGIWGHSNGGQIALSVLEITKKDYPTVLWAPVTMGFPESVTAYFEDLPDKGAYLQGQLDLFHERYIDTDFSIADEAWMKDISPQLQIHQGRADEAFNPDLTSTFVARMKDYEKDVVYYEYPRENHNFQKGNFAEMVTKDIQYYKKALKIE